MAEKAEEQELIIEQIEIGPMQNFTYLVGSRATREVVVVDPAWDIAGLLKHVAERDYVLKGALVTHYHPDHCGGSFGGHSVEGVSELLDSQGMKVYVHNEEADGLKKVTGISDSDMVKVSSGDTLFIQGCGRVDLPGSDSEEMFRSLRKLAELPDDTLLLPGHNYGHVPNATMGETKQQNTYLQVNDLETWKTIMGG